MYNFGKDAFPSKSFEGKSVSNREIKKEGKKNKKKYSNIKLTKNGEPSP
jgi:hypothetical protein